MKKLLFISLFMVIAGFMIQSCNDDNCSLTTAAVAHFDFLDSKTNSAVTLTNGIDVTGFIIADVTVKDTLSDGTIIDKVVKDSVLSDTVYNNATTSLSLPLSYTSRTTFVLHYTDLMKDTIQVNYQSIPYLESVECGTLMTYKINDVKYTTNVLDSVVIINPDVNNEEKRNFNIYYRAE